MSITHPFAQTASRCENQTVQKHVKKLTANGCENNKAAKLTLKRASLIDSSYQTIQMFYYFAQRIIFFKLDNV